MKGKVIAILTVLVMLATAGGVLAARGQGVKATGQTQRGQVVQELAMAADEVAATAAVSRPNCGTCGNYVDADGDGVCDNRGSGQGAGQGQGANYVDADGDGVCDNRGGAGQGQGANYVDADGDGFCDNRGTGHGQGHGGGRHHR